jgi:hypothetical protein
VDRLAERRKLSISSAAPEGARYHLRHINGSGCHALLTIPISVASRGVPAGRLEGMVLPSRSSIIRVERATHPPDQLIRRDPRGSPSDMAIPPPQDRGLPTGPISAGYCTIVLHHALLLESIGEAALTAAWQNSKYPEPIEIAARHRGASAPIRQTAATSNAQPSSCRASSPRRSARCPPRWAHGRRPAAPRE